MSGLRPPYKAFLVTELDAAARDRMWLRIEARRRRKNAPTLGGRSVVIGAVAGIVAVVAMAQLRSEPSPRLLAVGQVPSLAHSVIPAVPSGTVHAPGEAHYVATGSTRTIDAGLATLIFDDASLFVEQKPHHLTIRVERGEVVVRSVHLDGGVAHLHAGMLLEIDDAIAASAPGAVVPLWRSLAARGANPEAYRALGDGGISAASDRASIDDLLALADVARLSGHPREAIDPLTRVVSDYSTDGRAPLAALTLGRVYLDESDEPASAVEALTRALALGVPHALEEDAYARLVEARARAGDAAGARATYERAVTKFPNGTREPAMRKWVEAR